MKKLLGVLLLSAALCSAATVTFTEVPFPNLGIPTTEWSAYGITMQGVYFYVDSRDTFDTKGISISQAPGTVFFNTAVNNLSIDYWVIGQRTGTYSVYDAANNLLETLTINATGSNTLGSHAFSASSIARLEMMRDTGLVQVSTLRFDSIPEPSTMALVLIGLGAMAVSRFRRR